LNFGSDPTLNLDTDSDDQVKNAAGNPFWVPTENGNNSLLRQQQKESEVQSIPESALFSNQQKRQKQQRCRSNLYELEHLQQNPSVDQGGANNTERGGRISTRISVDKNKASYVGRTGHSATSAPAGPEVGPGPGPSSIADPLSSLGRLTSAEVPRPSHGENYRVANSSSAQRRFPINALSASLSPGPIPRDHNNDNDISSRNTSVNTDVRTGSNSNSSSAYPEETSTRTFFSSPLYPHSHPHLDRPSRHLSPRVQPNTQHLQQQLQHQPKHQYQDHQLRVPGLQYSPYPAHKDHLHLHYPAQISLTAEPDLTPGPETQRLLPPPSPTVSLQRSLGSGAASGPPIPSRPEKFLDEPLRQSSDSVATPASPSPVHDTSFRSVMDLDMSSSTETPTQSLQPQQPQPSQQPVKPEPPSQSAAASASNLTDTNPNAQGSSTTAAAAAAAANHLSFRRCVNFTFDPTCLFPPIANYFQTIVRCDAASLGVPCTNCVAFQIECRIPTPKRKKTNATGTNKDSDRSASDSPFPHTPNTGLTEVRSSEKGDNTEDRSPRAPSSSVPGTFPPRTPTVYHTSDGTPSSNYTESQARKEEVDSGTYLNLVMKPKFTRAPITDAGRVAYLGESSNLTLLVHDRQGSSDVVHYPLPENVRGSRARLTELDNVEIDILHQRGAFLLPPRSLCDELIDSYFKWIHPIVPVINRTRFMRQYRDPKNPPSLLLLQAVLLAGSRVCTNPQLMDANGSTTPAALTFYKRAKALYDANYEDDRVTIVQSLLLMGWYWEGPEDVTKNVFYWSRVATIVAQGSGMHRSVEQSQLSRSDKRLWKRIWWTLFTRDRSVAVALGRPVHINLDDSDVEMLTEDDFIEDEGDRNSEYPPDPIHVQFFMQYVKLCEIMGLVLSQQYSVASKGRQRNAIDLTHSDMALADWLQNCPKIVYWEVARHHFWSALLHSNYYTTLCLLHRAHMPPNGGPRFPDDSPYPSRNIAFQAAAMITSIIENLAAHGELRFCPAFVVYSLFSALIMHVYQMRSPVPSIQQVTQDRLRTCMQALKEVSRVWLVGKMVYTLFESIIGNKVLEERLQKAAGKRHRKAQQALAQLEQQQRPQDVAKRKYDDMAIDFSVNTPTPQESYERSRPQTPSHMKGDGASNAQPMAPPVTSPNHRQPADTFMGGTSSRPHTRPATPFNPSFSVPATPPDLYLVTRNSPNISQSLWENFQPDQLFPDSASMPAFPHMSPPPPNQQGMEAGMMSQMQNPNIQTGITGQSSQFQQRSINKTGMGGSPPHGLASGVQGFQQQPPLQQPQAQAQGPNPNNNGNSLNSSLWTANFDGLMPDGQSPSDSWSTGSAQGQPVPNTLNVEDWFQFFGINNGDLANMNLDLGLGPQ
ncbi:Cutinase transcription factor 1 alpha 1, partial [Colletotrichum chlorophyti]